MKNYFIICLNDIITRLENDEYIDNQTMDILTLLCIKNTITNIKKIKKEDFFFIHVYDCFIKKKLY